MDTELLSERFQRFAAREGRGSSPLYERLSLEIARDKELLTLSASCSPGQPIPNLVFGAVHYLLLSGVDHELRECYPTISRHPRSVDDAFPRFKDFCHQYRNELRHLLQTKLVQTNEIRRCTYLYPSFCYIYHRAEKPLALIEIGTSAGLQLLWDKYSYSYPGIPGRYGDRDSRVHLTAELPNGQRPALSNRIPPVASKVGVDLHVINLADAGDVLWMQALIWPEHEDRRTLFAQAVQLWKAHSVTLIEGDGVLLLPGLADQAPTDSVLCVFHTHVANQMPDALKWELLDTIKSISATRDVFHLYNNVFDSGKLHLDYFIEGTEFNAILADTDGHGRWFDWTVI